MYGNGIVMGLTPRDVDEMSLAQYLAASAGWEKANGDEEAVEPPSG